LPEPGLVTPSIEVAAGVLEDSRGFVLVSQRTAGRHEAGAWEFPGGKIKVGETPEEALLRELQEEIGIDVVECEPLISYTHEYPDRQVTLHVYKVIRWTGQPAGLEGQPLEWLPVNQLLGHGLLPGDRPIVERLGR
jgi:8-oxo-dGTP diphosphatase